MTQLALVIDLNVCVGCHACVTTAPAPSESTNLKSSPPQPSWQSPP